ncbi:hypothetical protein EJ377_15125 [Chryseobacterium arthrosphaerae]|uniref:Uncharacterized protein n=1 Tax=Chryseobacterium arthrosphaerae TaxID=651561 RepID=A0A3S0N4M7_9FLAO|nr:hypothetical protein EJ377_15125 [Chryseobacterium arthrosphaerae]
MGITLKKRCSVIIKIVRFNFDHLHLILYISLQSNLLFGSYDLETGEVKNDSVVKTKYDAYGDAAYTYYYDVSGKVYVMEEGNGGLFSGEFPETYYSEALPLFPETENKDNTGLKSL